MQTTQKVGLPALFMLALVDIFFDVVRTVYMLNKYRSILDAVRSIHTVKGSDASIMTVLEIWL